MRLLFALCLGLLLVIVTADKCSYDYCVKDELYRCQETENRELCHSQNGLFVTYRTGTFSKASHRCCKMTLIEAKEMYLGCVRNIRSTKTKCSTSSDSSWKTRFRTKDGCVEFYCDT